MKQEIKDIILIFSLLLLMILLILLLAVIGYSQIDPEKSCEDLTLKQCYDYCKSKTYLLGQDCKKIIIELKEIREILN